MLPEWDPARLAAKTPFNLALIGGRRMGKSTAVTCLLDLMKSRFKLVVALLAPRPATPSSSA